MAEEVGGIAGPLARWAIIIAITLALVVVARIGRSLMRRRQPVLTLVALLTALCAVIIANVTIGWWAPALDHAMNNALVCATTSSECSVVEATWMIFFATAGACLGALLAVWWASRAYFYEARSVLGEDVCIRDDCERADRTFYITPGGGMSPRPPLGFEQEPFVGSHRRYINFGRSPLGRVTLAVTIDDVHSTYRVTVPIGNLGISDEHRERHVAFYTVASERSRIYATRAFVGKTLVDEFFPLDEPRLHVLSRQSRTG